VHIAGAVVAVDRQEKGTGALTALEEIAQEQQMIVAPIITISEAADYLLANDIAGKRYLSPADRVRIAQHLAGQ
jgi:orotate phosphoribosyltransferase